MVGKPGPNTRQRPKNGRSTVTYNRGPSEKLQHPIQTENRQHSTRSESTPNWWDHLQEMDISQLENWLPSTSPWDDRTWHELDKNGNTKNISQT